MFACCGSSNKDVNENEKLVTQKFDRQLEQQNKESKLEIKLLLLGSGDSGKSTFFRQIQNNFGTGFTQDQLNTYKLPIQTAFLRNLQAATSIMEQIRQSVDESNSEFAQQLLQMQPEVFQTMIMSSNKENEHYTEDSTDNYSTFVDKCYKLARDSNMKSIFEAPMCYQLKIPAHVKTILQSSVLDQNYTVSVSDLVRYRLKTTQVQQISFKVQGRSFRLIDVGGQIAERKKWSAIFKDAASIVYVASMIDYDLTLDEDPSVNRMVDSLQLFEQTINCETFRSTPIILLLNKFDLFKTKVETVPLRNTFKDFKEPQEPHKYIQDRFLALNKNPRRQIYSFFSTAIDGEIVNEIFKTSVKILLKEEMSRLGFE
ncbi:G-protein_alpha subunit [Hexamita inflata]|uniref:G-protein alpha subunit n=1 Tax=Hexamita inflata TaxID=28002 RepID=A0AA86UPX1_9EUKA|nr:G-protein alpha subunit [Hexamita inflata]